MPKSSKISAGLLMYRKKNGRLEVFLAHPGGPFFKNKDKGVWTIPKGEVDSKEDLLKSAIREFKEEIGIEPKGEFLALGSVVQKSGKVVYAWAFEGDFGETQKIRSNTFRLEWPPKSGTWQEFPEIDQAKFFLVEEAKGKLLEAQQIFLERLISGLKSRRL